MSPVAFGATVQPHRGSAETATFTSWAPEKQSLNSTGDTEYDQAFAPVWITTNDWPPTVIVPVRAAASWLNVTPWPTAPAPQPDAPDVTVGQAVDEAVVQAHPPGAATANDPAPPAAPIAMDVDERAKVHDTGLGWVIANSDQPLPGATADGAEEHALLEIERGFTAAAMTRDMAFFDRHVAKECVQIVDGKPVNFAAVLADMRSGAMCVYLAGGTLAASSAPQSWITSMRLFSVPPRARMTRNPRSPGRTS